MSHQPNSPLRRLWPVSKNRGQVLSRSSAILFVSLYRSLGQTCQPIFTKCDFVKGMLSDVSVMVFYCCLSLRPWYWQNKMGSHTYLGVYLRLPVLLSSRNRFKNDAIMTTRIALLFITVQVNRVAFVERYGKMWPISTQFDHVMGSRNHCCYP